MSLKDTTFNYVKKLVLNIKIYYFPDMYLNVGSG